MNDILDAENEFVEKILQDEIDRLNNEISKYKILLKEAGLEDDTKGISEEEAICITQILKLKKKSDKKELNMDEVKRLDLLVKNLKLIRGENTRAGRKSKLDQMSTKDLVKELK